MGIHDRVTETRHSIRAAATALLLVAMSLLMPACDRGGPEESHAGIARKTERGTVTATVRIDHDKITIAEKLNFRIEISTMEDVQVDLPPVGEKLDQFGIIDYTTLPPALLENGATIIRRSYVLEPLLSGEYEIPSMKVQYWKKGVTPRKVYILETEPLPVTVISIIPAGMDDIHDIAPPVAPSRPGPWLGILIGLIVAICATVTAMVLRGWHRKPIPVSQARRLTAYEIAFRELESLVARDLIGNGELKLFYQIVSNILRRYIERRFSLCAPEQTTEEFMDTLRNSDALVPDNKMLLEEFLVHCDLVKFAQHQPGREEIQLTFDRCRSFITETKEIT
jgi:hypothetical protein